MKPETLAIRASCFHVTFTATVPAIRASGLRSTPARNWAKAGDLSPYGEGEIYAFEHVLDAHAWAFKMEFDLLRTSFTGAISVVRFRGDGEWYVDYAGPYAPGRHWLKRWQAVPADCIEEAAAFTRETALDWRSAGSEPVARPALMFPA